MSNLSEKLKSNEEVKKQELINYAIGIQLEKIEKHMNRYGKKGPKFLISESTELAMTNLIELLKLKEDENTVNVGVVELWYLLHQVI